MKKMPTLFVREYDAQGRPIVPISREVTKGCEWVMDGEGIATRKWDGTCCLVDNGKIYARFDFKPGRKLPIGAIPCQEKPDENTGHFPHWVEVTEDNPQYKWHWAAFQKQKPLPNGTYELCGWHFQNNAELIREDGDILIRHGNQVRNITERTYDGIRDYLDKHMIEGIVFYRGNGEMCKIKRTDFGLSWRER